MEQFKVGHVEIVQKCLLRNGFDAFLKVEFFAAVRKVNVFHNESAFQFLAQLKRDSVHFLKMMRLQMPQDFGRIEKIKHQFAAFLQSFGHRANRVHAFALRLEIAETGKQIQYMAKRIFAERTAHIVDVKMQTRVLKLFGIGNVFRRNVNARHTETLGIQVDGMPPAPTRQIQYFILRAEIQKP